MGASIERTARLTGLLESDVHALGEHIDRFIAVRGLSVSTWAFYAFNTQLDMLLTLAMMRGIPVVMPDYIEREKGYRNSSYAYITKGDV